MSVDTMRTLVRKLGDVEVIVRLPLDVPDPRIDLAFHLSETTEAQRLASCEALHMDETNLRDVGDFAWFETSTDGGWKDGQLTATVFVAALPVVVDVVEEAA